MQNPITFGLYTENAIQLLTDKIEEELLHCKCDAHGANGFRQWLSETFSHQSVTSTFQWPSAVLMLFCCVGFALSYTYTLDHWLLWQCLFLLTVLVINCFLVGLETHLRHREIHTKAQLIIKKIRDEILCEDSEWLDKWKESKQYPHIHLPETPCISLQLTYRDGQLVNLPASLLVEGDVIVMSPGRSAPADCNCLQSECGIKHLQRAEMFSPPLEHSSHSTFQNSRMRGASKAAMFVLNETPYIHELRLALERSCRHSCSAFDKELHTVMIKYVQNGLAPCLLMLCFGVGLFQHWSIQNTQSNFELDRLSTSILKACLTILPLLPLTAPITWTLLNAYGYAKLNFIARAGSACAKSGDNFTGAGVHWSPGTPAAATFQLGKCGADNETDKFYDYELETNSMPSESEHIESSFKFLAIWKQMWRLITSQEDTLWRSGNLLHGLGSITALCCVDKKGILSTANPSADKVFFLSSSKQQEVEQAKSRKSKLSKVEVLDVTPDASRGAHGIQFDDPHWQRCLPNLKPLGLAILLNTCNVEAQDEYSRFSDHLANESHQNEASLPVVRKRCLCEFARKVGFTSAATSDYQYLTQIGCFRQIRPEVVQQGRLAKSLRLPRLKLPFPNLSASLMRDACSNSFFLFSQGSGDLLLDSCNEFWNGEDLCPLTEADRKHILDFYQRTSLTAYCLGFAYLPLSTLPDKQLLNDQYIEFAPDSSHVFGVQKSRDGISVENSHLSSTGALNSSLLLSGSQNISTGQLITNSRPLLSTHLSSDSLTLKDGEVVSPRPLSANSNHSTEMQSMEPLIGQLNNQIFLGLITLQYHACADFVRLVERLEKACVRFVHFSKENELRSRVFSEKMGLESGWNCHISLLSEPPTVCMGAMCDHSTCDQGKIDQQFTSESAGQMNGTLSGQMQSPPGSSSPSCFLMRSQSAPSHVNLQNCLQTSGELEGSSEQLASEDSRRTEIAQPELSVSPSLSRVTDSSGTDTSPVPITFDISNRAKLPKGIENIRPHLEEVDNVPLLVSLFTDCIPETTVQMIQIMQEYGEVVCVLGSSANLNNMNIFLQADTSIGIEPLYPHLCLTMPTWPATSENEADRKSSLGEHSSCESNSESTKNTKSYLPIDVSNQLNTLPCAMTLKREECTQLTQLIGHSRHFIINARNCLNFYLCCCLSLSLAQILSCFLLLPSLFSPGQLLWMLFALLPALSHSLIASQANPHLMTLATGKNLNLSKESISYFMICYLIKFSLSAMAIVVIFALLIFNFCNSDFAPDFGLNSTKCWQPLNASSTQIIKESELWPSYLLFCQSVASFFFFFYLVIISSGFVHRSHLLWQKSPFTNRCWVLVSIVTLFANSIFSWCNMQTFNSELFSVYQFITSTPLYIQLMCFLAPLPLISVNVLVKKRELKIYERQQRRARLEFGTKLGMNSPF